jgi:glycosyltransferase involved in cell wall biosynthesis
MLATVRREADASWAGFRGSHRRSSIVEGGLAGRRHSLRPTPERQLGRRSVLFRLNVFDQIVNKLLFRANGRLRNPFVRLLFDESGRVRDLFRRFVYRTSGRARAPFFDGLSYTRAAFADEDTARRGRAVAVAALSGVAHLDPDLAGIESIVRRRPVVDGTDGGDAFRVWKAIYRSLDHAPEHIVFMPSLVRGGAGLVAVYAARAVMETKGRTAVLLVVTDGRQMDAVDWLPEGLAVRAFADYDPRLSLDDRARVVDWLVRALEPKSIFGVHSQACWEFIKQYGHSASRTCDLYAALFCNEYNKKGASIGFADRYFRDAAPHLKKIYFDNESFIHELVAQFGVPSSLRERLAVSYQPAPEFRHFEYAAPVPGRPLPVMWAGRLSRQKNVELLIDIARHDDQFEFGVHGNAEDDYGKAVEKEQKLRGNIVYHGGFSNFAALPTSRYGAYLYTSLWDGLPNVLLAAAASGLPIVASAVGGIEELVDETTGWPIRDHRNPQAYLEALRVIRDDPEEARRRTEAMRRRLDERHSWAAYVASMSGERSFLG